MRPACPLGKRNMKAITITQPWATLIAIGAKSIETRSWSTEHRGPLAIHSAKRLGWVGGMKGYRKICASEPFRTMLQARAAEHVRVDRSPDEQTEAPPTPMGCVIAFCELVEVVPVTQLKNLSAHEKAFGDYTPGRFGWILNHVRILPKPIPAKGKLGLWEFQI